MKRFRLHVVGLPHTSLTDAFTACAFTERVRKFCSMMTGRGHEVYLYAGPESEAEVAEHIPCMSEPERQAIVGTGHFVHASFDYNLPHWRLFNARAIAAMRGRIDLHDFICVIGGLAHKEIADAFPNHVTVEFSIGYGGTFSPWRIWESYAWMHTCYGSANRNPNAIDGRWFDDVIPGSFDPDQFPFRHARDKDDYFLYMGRLTERKGFGIAVDVCRRMGKRLVIAGQGDAPDFGEYVGVVGAEQRGELMAGARAVFVPTIYIEPFGNVAVEAQLCGTPVICSDWGAMTETVEQGVTGYRCRTLGEFMEAVTIIDAGQGPDATAAEMRRRAIEKYSTASVAGRYEKAFTRLDQLWREGWNEIPSN